MENIEKMIAEAKAEEEVAERQKKEQFKEDLRKGLQEALTKKEEEQSVKIPVSEYLILKMKERDLDILTGAIMDSLTLDYDKKNLKVYDGSKGLIISAFRTLFNFAYESILQDLQQEEGDE